MATRSTEKKMYSRLAASACAVALVAFAATGRGQAPAPPTPDPPPMGGNMAHFVGFEGNVGGRIVTGAPYSATVTTEFKRTLSDGTVIDRTTTSMIARDGMGRTRREMTMMAVGPFAASGAPPTVVMINDPVAHKHYVLNPKDKTARELGAGPRMGGFGGGRDGGHGGDNARDGGGRGFAGRGPDGHDGGHAGGPGGHDGGGRGGMRGGDQATTVSLGTQMIEGVSAEGTRTTSTIPAGAMGNQQPIMITFERWYSPDLLTDVKTVRSNPFEGTTTYMLTNLKRGEPDASLFTVPSDYKMMMAGGPGNHMGGGPGGKGGWSGGQHMHGGPGMGGPGNPGGAPNSNQAPPPPAAPGQGQDD